MTSKSLRRALLAATILAYPMPLYAQAPSPVKAESKAAMEILSPSSNWKVESGRIDLPQGGAVPYCAISNTYRDNGRLEFYGTSGSLAAIKADIPGQSFSEGDVLDVTLKMPGGYSSATRASVAGTSTLILNVKGDEALMTALYNGTLLYVGVGGRDYPFSLSGINNFGERIRTCSQSARTQNFVAVSPPDIQVGEPAPALAPAPAPVEPEPSVVQAPAVPQEDVAVPVQEKEELPAQLSLPFSQEPAMAPPVSEVASDKAKEQEAARKLAEQKLVEKERELAAIQEKTAQDLAVKDQIARDQAAKERAARELAEKELAAKEQELAAKEKQLVEKDQAIRALAAKNQAEKKAQAENEVLKVLMAPAKSDPAMSVQHVPGAAAAMQAVQEPDQAPLNAPPPAVPAKADASHEKVLARIGDKPSSSPKQFDALFTNTRPVTTAAAPVQEQKSKSSPAVSVAKVASVPPQSEGQLSSEAPPVWRALKGSSLREVLALWSMDNDVELIWDSNEQYRIKETVSLKSSYESAVETLLRQYESGLFSPAVRRPVGQIYVDPAKGSRVLVIRSQTG